MNELNMFTDLEKCSYLMSKNIPVLGIDFIANKCIVLQPDLLPFGLRKSIVTVEDFDEW